MPFALVANKAANQILNSAEWNQIDEDHTRTVNVVDGDTCSPTNPVEFTGGIVRFKTAGVLAIGATGELTIENTGDLVAESGATATFESGSALVLDAGSVLNLTGTGAVNGLLGVNTDLNVNNGGTLAILAGGVLELQSTITPTYDSPRTFTRTANPVAAYNFTNYASPVHQSPVGHYTYVVLDDGTDAWLMFAIDPPDGCTITSCTIRIDPPAHANQPAIMPELHLYTQNVTDGSAVTDDSQADTSADAAAYGAAHSITVTGLSIAVDKSLTAYWLGFRGEGITDGVANCRVDIPRVTFTRAKLGEE